MSNLIIVMGVSGSGKSLVGNHLSRTFNIEFSDGDDLHLPVNIRKMESRTPLTDQDRQPWLEAICQHAENAFKENRHLVISCSALKSSYRKILRSVSQPVLFVFLRGEKDLIQNRLNDRAAKESHFMPIELLRSQIADLEDPSGEPNVIVIDIDQDLNSMLAESEREVRNRLENQ